MNNLLFISEFENQLKQQEIEKELQIINGIKYEYKFIAFSEDLIEYFIIKIWLMNLMCSMFTFWFKEWDL